MKFEKEYAAKTTKEKIKKYGQFFTPYLIADFMISWILESKPKTILDPAVGNGVFFRNIKDETIELTGYEIDKEIFDFFKEKNTINYNVIFRDYLLNGWKTKFDAIICNPPYNRFQMIDNREEIRENFTNIVDMKIDGYTNLYIMFLIKSIFQLNKKGRLAYIIPTEFLNSGYGEQIKSLLIKQKNLKAIIGFDDSIQVFDNVLTTACIMLIENKKHEYVEFINIKNPQTLNDLNIKNLKNIDDYSYRNIDYRDLNAEDKWEQYFQEEQVNSYKNLVTFSSYAKVKRGIATGDNSFFVFNESKKLEYNIDERNLIPCITRSNDLDSGIFTMTNFEILKQSNKNVYIFDGTLYEDDSTLEYIKIGEANEVNKKYLTSSRPIWYMSENKEPGDILLNVFSRGKLKIIRNLTSVKNLTTFHSIYLNEDKAEFVNILFCYLLTPIGQEILYRNKRVYGGGLSKFEPNDINSAFILDLNIISLDDRNTIIGLYNSIIEQGITNHILDALNNIFSSYLI